MTVIELVLLGGLALVAALCVLILLRAGRAGNDGVPAQIEALNARLGEIQTSLTAGLGGIREESAVQARAAREELSARIDVLGSNVTNAVGQIGTAQGERLDALSKAISNGRIETQNDAAALRKDLLANFAQLTTSVADRMIEQATAQADRLEAFTRNLEEYRRASGEAAHRSGRCVDKAWQAA